MNRGKVNEIREALSRLPSLGRAELRAEWQRLYGTDAPVRLGHELLIGAIAWRLQENMLGGLRPALRRRLRPFAEQAPGSSANGKGARMRSWLARMASCGSRRTTGRCRRSPGRSPVRRGRARCSLV